jgi:hypothetical protein
VFISAMRDKSPNVVLRACDSIGEIAQLLGPNSFHECTSISSVASFLPFSTPPFLPFLPRPPLYYLHVHTSPVMPKIIEEFLLILEKKAPCQTRFTEGDELEAGTALPFPPSLFHLPFPPPLPSLTVLQTIQIQKRQRRMRTTTTTHASYHCWTT